MPVQYGRTRFLSRWKLCYQTVLKRSNSDRAVKFFEIQKCHGVGVYVFVCVGGCDERKQVVKDILNFNFI